MKEKLENIKKIVNDALDYVGETHKEEDIDFDVYPALMLTAVIIGINERTATLAMTGYLKMQSETYDDMTDDEKALLDMVLKCYAVYDETGTIDVKALFSKEES